MIQLNCGSHHASVALLLDDGYDPIEFTFNSMKMWANVRAPIPRSRETCLALQERMKSQAESWFEHMNWRFIWVTLVQ